MRHREASLIFAGGEEQPERQDVLQDETSQAMPPTLEEITRKLDAAIPALGSDQQRAALTLHQLLTEGEPVHPRRVAAATGLSTESVQRWLAAWPDAILDEDSVVAFWGLDLRQTRHRFEVNGRTLYAWCAWDALFLPELIGLTARVSSTGPEGGAPISLVVPAAGHVEADPASTVVSFLVPEAHFRGNLIACFCHFVHFFGSSEEGEHWCAEHPDTFVLSVAAAHELGRLMNRRRFGEALGSG